MEEMKLKAGRPPSQDHRVSKILAAGFKPTESDSKPHSLNSCAMQFKVSQKGSGLGAGPRSPWEGG